MKTESVLEKILDAGHLAVTSECGPPRGALPEKVREKAEMLRGYVDAVNVTDNQTAMVRMSSLAACILIRQMGLHPIFQMVTRDRNRLAMQSDILGAYSHGIDTMGEITVLALAAIGAYALLKLRVGRRTGK